ncbi:GNAT family N-acetyltransferase [Bacillus thuringiensis serovar pingluonsis]|uniref:GNAT family N-acetyltransferase n=1 Tax=Bacillus thuringiensis serovar pingluonsis TaxID=180881 RepID=A0A243BB37_BACTU|nr:MULTISPECIES: GNAT family N-acetyltransferase [Bacillus cereus group]MEB9682992.1 GNAT family N-acetyltransferase [Bacillus anthracis]OTY41976.1 GNAT family N-acetyltransferase [Bacillus thuringiensis serovar pingluonsis]
MPLVSNKITEYWNSQFLNGIIIYSDKTFTVTINPNLSKDSRVMTLETNDGRFLAVLTPKMANILGFSKGQELSESDFRQKLHGLGVTMHGADCLFYFSEAEKKVLLQENQNSALRQLNEKDDKVFLEFESSASEQDLDDAYVELDHWAVFGSFVKNKLVCVASMYPWEEDVQIADLGVLTLLPFRGKGHARQVVRTICKYALEQGYEPQYRCQLNNEDSKLLAKAAGLTLLGKWDVISPNCTVGEFE